MAYTPTEWVSGTIISASKLNNIERGVESVNSEYTPTTWAEGDTVTAAKLNKIEQGIAAVSGGVDLSTATVTFINTFDGQSVEFSHANADEIITIDGKEYSGLINTLTENTVLLVGNTPTKVMASGSEYGGGWPMIESITATGSITVGIDPDTNNPMAVVSGNGTITMNWTNAD